jgi:hypothetical protein
MHLKKRRKDGNTGPVWGEFREREEDKWRW